jgi:branched-chain amino acid transport system ATP-binding protein
LEKGQNVLEIEGLTKYFGGLAAVSGLDMSVKSGEILGLIGPNGAGKTTFFNLVTGFLRPTKGRVIFEGKDITAKNSHYVAGKGMVRTFQLSNIFPDFTVRQNIVLAHHLKPRIGFWETVFHTRNSQRKEEDILRHSQKILELVGIEAMADIAAGTLPHGHKRLLGIAIALAAEPKLLLLDEPLSGMSAEEVSETMGLINRLWQSGITILLIEHNMRGAMSLCHRLVVINFGKKIAEGLPQEIRENKDVIQAYLGAGEHDT